MIYKVFFDANVLLDCLDKNRPFHSKSKFVFDYCADQKFKLFTSCDLITTIYYLIKNKKTALNYIIKISKLLKIIEFSNDEINDACQLMLQDNDYDDLEDTIQYILAKKSNCDLIISNDNHFTAKNIKTTNSTDFLKLNV